MIKELKTGLTCWYVTHDFSIFQAILKEDITRPASGHGCDGPYYDVFMLLPSRPDINQFDKVLKIGTENTGYRCFVDKGEACDFGIKLAKRRILIMEKLKSGNYIDSSHAAIDQITE